MAWLFVWARAIWEMSVQGIVSEHALTWRIAMAVIPPLVRLGLLDCIGSVLLAGMIGGFVACFSNCPSTRRDSRAG